MYDKVFNVMVPSRFTPMLQFLNPWGGGGVAWGDYPVSIVLLFSKRNDHGDKSL